MPFGTAVFQAGLATVAPGAPCDGDFLSVRCEEGSSIRRIAAVTRLRRYSRDNWRLSSAVFFLTTQIFAHVPVF